jgi:hypothetical protein
MGDSSVPGELAEFRCGVEGLQADLPSVKRERSKGGFKMSHLDRTSGRHVAAEGVSSPPARTVIEVSDVEPATTVLREVAFHRAVDNLLNPHAPATDELPTTAIEACSDTHGPLVANVRFHAGVAAIDQAFNDHRPLVLSPDIIWMFLAQGFANHVNAHAETLRDQFVSHSGKLALEVQRHHFIKGSAENDWPGVIDELSVQIRRHVGETTHDLLVPTFTTTGPVERIAAQVALLDAMQSYFAYQLTSFCGIPVIALEGTDDDWRSLAARAEQLGRFGLEWWTRALRPILDEFIAAACGRANPEFWQSIYKREGGSGGPFVTGWILAFFPYLKDERTRLPTRRNECVAEAGASIEKLLAHDMNEKRRFLGVNTDMFPSGLARAPFQWMYRDESYAMEFLGGFVGVRQDGTDLSLRPEIGWAIDEPARREPLLQARGEEYRRLADEQSRLAMERARSWKRKGLCPICGTWVYIYTDEEHPGHCTNLVNVSRRQA